MRWLFVVFNCEAVTLPSRQITNDEKVLQSKIIGKMCTAKLDPHNQSIPDSVTHPRSLVT